MDDLLKTIGAFEFESNQPAQLKEKWINYKREFSYTAAIFNREQRRNKTKIFLAVAGRQLQKVYEDVVLRKLYDNYESPEEEFDDVIKLLDTYFMPKQHEAFERSTFWTLKPDEGETLDKFLFRAKTKANDCRFGRTEAESREIAVMDKIISLAPPELRKKILEKGNLNLDRLTRIVRTFYSVQRQSNEYKRFEAPGSSNNTSRPSLLPEVNKISSHGKNQSFGKPTVKSQNNEECTRCGFKDHKREDEKCPARKTQCSKCKLFGHFARMCRTSNKRKMEQEQSQNNYDRKQRDYKRARVNMVHDQIENDDDEEACENFVNSLSDNHDELVWFKVGNVLIEMMIDSGSKFNVISENTWKYLCTNQASVRRISSSNKKLKAYGQQKPLEIICTFEAELSINDSGKKLHTSTIFYVIKGVTHNLLGKESALNLGVLFIGLPSSRMQDIGQIESQSVEEFPYIHGKIKQ